MLLLFLPASRFDPEGARRSLENTLNRIDAVPGVESSAVGSNLPLSRLTMPVPFSLKADEARDRAERLSAGCVSISPSYLRSLRIPLKRGRDLTNDDTEARPFVALVNETFAKR
jgi:hypothetical protein